MVQYFQVCKGCGRKVRMSGPKPAPERCSLCAPKNSTKKPLPSLILTKEEKAGFEAAFKLLDKADRLAFEADLKKQIEVDRKHA